MEEYDKNAWYVFRDKDGNEVFRSRGDNGYVWQSITTGTPISINQQGDWYIEPYLETTPNGLVAHIPSWFKETEEYNEWANSIVPQINSMPINNTTIQSAKDTLKALGNQGMLRNTIYNETDKIGITDPEQKRQAFDDINAIRYELKDNVPAQLNILQVAGDKASAADIARVYKNLSKEDLSKQMMGMEQIINAKSKGKWDQKTTREAYVLTQLLNIVADNPSSFGDGKEFEGLLEASEWQKFQAHINSWLLGVGESAPFGGWLAARTAAGVGTSLRGGTFADGWNLEKQANAFGGPLYNEAVGGGLRGTEGSIVSGSVSSNVITAAGTMIEAAAFGGWLDSTKLGASIGNAFKSGTTTLGKIGGGMVYDWVAHDVPIDLTLFASDMATTGELQESWESKTNTQPLFGFFGPEVPAGLKYNLIGDAVMDLTLPMLGLGNKAAYNKLDTITGGSVSKIRESAKIRNLKVQQAISDFPVIGTGLRKFSDWLFGAELTSNIRVARKAAIEEGSMTQYEVAHNLATIRNHKGAEIVAPMYYKKVNDLDINKQIEYFQKNASSYGGMGEVRNDWKTAKQGIGKNLYEVVQDDIPLQVKNGLLDYQRIEELKGEVEIEGGVLSNPKRQKEIAELEKRVDALPNEIKKFAADFSELNKYVEQMRVSLGLTTQDWIDALNVDPRWKNYMTRQVLVPGGIRGAGNLDPTTNKLLTGKRTGYYNPEKTLSPVTSLDMKVHALGQAYAWNETAKALVANELILGKITSGGDSVDLAKRISDKRNEIMAANAKSAKLGYDAIIKGFTNRTGSLSEAVKNINNALNSVDNITAKSVYTVGDNLDTKGFIADFNSGKISYADGVIDEAGISVQDSSTIIQNTYRDKNGFAGISSAGVPYKYTVEGNKITSLLMVDTDEGYSEALNSLSGGRYSITPEQVAKIGHKNAAAVNLAVSFYDNNLPQLQTGSSVHWKRDRNYGFEPWIGNDEWGWHIDNGHIVADKYPVYLGTAYMKGNENSTLAAKKRECEVDPKTGISYKPKNTATLESTPIHEMGHSYMTQLAVASLNRKIDNGELSLSDINQKPLHETVLKERCLLEETFVINAMERLGHDVTGIKAGELWPQGFINKARKEASQISGYAGDPVKGRNGRLVRNPSGNPVFWELFSEGARHYAGNGADSTMFAVEIVNQMSAKGQQFSGAFNPKATLEENSLVIPRGLLKGNEYNFPAKIKTDVQKSEWLDQWRQKNPYLKEDFNEDIFRKANLWDSYFQKEIRTYNVNSTSTSPEVLFKKSGDFVEKQRAIMAKKLTTDIKKLSNGGFDSDLAMIIMGRNGNDIAKAMDNYIIRQIDISAEELAKNMEGGATADNLNTARITLWSDENIKNSTQDMLYALVPDGGDAIVSKIDILFDTQAKGLASYEALSLDAKQLIEEKDKLVKQLYRENEKTLKFGKEADKKSSFIDGGTHVIHYLEGGEDVYVTVDDPIVASILQRPYNYKETGMVAETFQTIASLMSTTYRLGTTGVNPMAFIRNVLRDPIQAMVTDGFNPLNMTVSPEVFYKTLRQYGLDNDTISMVTERINNWAKSSTMTEEMRLGPGKNSASYRNEVQKINNKLREFTNGKIIQWFQTPLESWEGYFRNQVGQQSFVKNFKRTGDVDRALSSALFDTSNATTNFSHAVAGFKNITSTVPYLSSAINGTASFWRLFNMDPLGMTARITAGFMVPVMAVTAWNLSSEENRRAYETLPEWFKQSHIVLTDPSGNIIAFPLPEEIQQFAGTARKLIEFTHEVSPYSLATIAAQGAFGFLPFEVDGFWGDDGSLQLKEGSFQMVSGLIPQAATTMYESIWQQDLFTGQDLSTYNGLNTAINTMSNIFGTGIVQAFNSLGIMFGVPEKDLIGKSFQNTIARDLFGMGFDAAKQQFMTIVGSPAKLKENGEMSQATGLFKKNEELKKKIDAISTQIAVSEDNDKQALEEQKKKLVDDFTNEVKNSMDKYQRMFQVTGGLEQWQKNRLIQLLTLGDAWSSADSSSYQSANASEAFLDERGLALQRYVNAGLPAGPDVEDLVPGGKSIELQAALNSFYGSPKQATQDYKNAIEKSGVKDIRNEFYSVIQKIYDDADANNTKPDYDMIERIQARYLQSVDAVIAPIINRYGIDILNNNDFVDAVRRQVNGMIPSDDWRQSTKNAKKFLSTKEFPTAGVDVKKWLMQRYSSGMRDRGLSSDAEVTQKLQDIKKDIDAGNRGSAKGKIESLRNGINKSNYYISATDYQTLINYYNMVK